jgi:hypothetical protein
MSVSRPVSAVVASPRIRNTSTDWTTIASWKPTLGAAAVEARVAAASPTIPNARNAGIRPDTKLKGGRRIILAGRDGACLG